MEKAYYAGIQSKTLREKFGKYGLWQKIMGRFRGIKQNIREDATLAIWNQTR
jgi:hypothetical protein